LIFKIALNPVRRWEDLSRGKINAQNELALAKIFKIAPKPVRR